MGKHGPRPTPTAQLKLAGSWRANCREGEPEPNVGRPDCPEWLQNRGRELWDVLLPKLEAMRVLTVIDGLSLARYCRAFVRWLEAEEFIDQHGSTYPLKDEQGNVKYLQQFPQVAISHKLALQLGRLEQEFGMTPSARTRIRMEPAKPPTSDKKPSLVKSASA